MTTDLEQEARWYAKRGIITPMQTGYQGLYDANTETIYIADDLTPTQYRCVLASKSATPNTATGEATPTATRNNERI